MWRKPAEFFKASSLDRVQESSAEQTIETPDITLAEEIVEGLVLQKQQVVDTSVQHVVDAVEVEKHVIHEKINQVTSHVEIPLLQIGKKTVEVPEVPPFTDKFVDNLVVAQRQISMVQTVQTSIEIPQLQHCDEVIDVPVVSVVQVPRVWVVKKKTVEDPQFQIVEKIR